MLKQLLSLRYYLVFVLLAYGTFVWAGLHGHRLLGDDNESTENLNGTGTHGSGRAGRGLYFHK